MPPAAQPHLRSATRKIVQQSLNQVQRPCHRGFHHDFTLRVSGPSRDGADTETSESYTPTAATIPDLEKIRKNLLELYAGLSKEREKLKKYGIAISDKADENKANGSPAGDEPSSRPEKVASSFHGSARRRRLRGISSREAQKRMQQQVPKWFLDQNVQLAEEQRGLEGFATLTGVAERTGSTPSIDPLPENTASVLATPPIDLDSGQYDSLRVMEGENSAFKVQLRELETIAQGLLRLPRHERFHSFTPEQEGPHLILDHQDPWAKPPGAVWRDLIEDLATRLDCDLLVLNAQDIGELIASANLGDEISSEAITLNYDIWNKISRARGIENIDATKLRPAKFGGKRDTQWKEEDLDENDDFEDMSMEGQMPPFGAPMMIGKPIAIDITKLLRSQAERRGGPRKTNGIPSFMSGLFDDEASKATVKDDSHIFSEVVGGVLSAPKVKRLKYGTNLSQSHAVKNCMSSSDDAVIGAEIGDVASDSDSMLGVPGRRLLIYIQAFDALEDHNLGQQFLSELYLQVHRRRMSGEQLLIVGAPPYVSEERTDWINGPDNAYAAKKVALTPPEVPAQDVGRLRKLSIQNVTAINYRNLRTMLDTKWNTDAWKSFDPRSRSFFEDVAKTSSMPETVNVWEMRFVRQLASVMWGMLEQQPGVNPSITEAMALLDESARSKAEWRKQRAKDRPLHLLVSPEDTRISKIRSSATKHEKALLAGVIEPSKISVTFEDVHAPFETIESIQTMTTLSLVRPEAFRYGVLASDRLPGLLLYGPPGTGKTLLAKAVAKESGATVLSVSSAQLNDMYVGEGEKNVAALFSLAKKLTPCIIFLDEADAIFSARGNRGSRVNHRELLNQFLTEWDGMSNDASGAFIMVATNRPMDLDDAVLRRLPRRLLVDLPTESDRLAILQIHLREEVLADEIDLAELAKKTPFYSGSDLKNLAVAAALECVREENEAAKKYVGEEAYKYAEKRTLTAAHFEKALGDISASISEDMSSLREIKKFDEQYGDKRGKKGKSSRWGFNTAIEVDKVLDTVKVRS